MVKRIWRKLFPIGACLGKGLIVIDSIVVISHRFVSNYVQPGGIVVDATAGNGWDTLFLAQLVGSRGTVHSFDIQKKALEQTKTLLAQHNCVQRVQLHLANHQDISQYVDGPVQAVMFNLGYLPGGDKQITTCAQSSLIALGNCLSFLAPGGIISVVTYSGHPGGEEEEEKVGDWCRSLPTREYTAINYSLINKPNRPPKLWLINFSNN